MMNLKRYATALATTCLLCVPALATAGPQDAQRFVTHLDGTQEVPERDTDATGQALFHLNDVETELTYKLIVANIDNVVAAHIHLGPAGANGPVVAFLAGSFEAGGGPVDGILAEGVITPDDLTGPFLGQDLSVLVAAMATSGTYVNVHTNDGVAPTNTGPGDFPGGEVRGQIWLTGPR